MNPTDQQAFSRRQWLGRMSTPAIAAATLGASVRDTAAAQEQLQQSPGARVYDIRNFGAKGDGTTLDTAAVQAAIDACTNEGGGTVIVPAGVFHIGTIELKSNVTLHL